MINKIEQYKKVLYLLDKNNVEYIQYEHMPALTYEDLLKVQKETGFYGSETKSMALNIGSSQFIVCNTLQGKRLNINKIKETINQSRKDLHLNEIKSIKLATKEELEEHFGAEPGCMYPFGFSKNIDIFVDETIFQTEWLLFSPVLPTRTIQAKAIDLKKVYDNIGNRVTYVNDFTL